MNSRVLFFDAGIPVQGHASKSSPTLLPHNNPVTRCSGHELSSITRALPKPLGILRGKKYYLNGQSRKVRAVRHRGQIQSHIHVICAAVHEGTKE